MPKAKHRSSGEGSIFKRKDSGAWVAEITLDPDPSGKRRVWRKYGKTRREVAEALATVLEQRRRGELVGTEKQTVADFLAAWLAGQKSHLAANTYVSYEQKVRLYILPSLGNLTLQQVTPQHVQTLLDGMGARGLAPRTIGYTRAVLRAALQQAVKWGTLVRNPAALASPPKVARAEVRSLSPDEVAKLVEAVKGHHLEALFTTVLAIGVREGEALALRWSDVDLDKRELRVVANLQRGLDGKLALTETKNATSRRVIALPSFAVAALKEHRVRQVEQRLRVGSGWQDSDLVFTTHAGHPIDRHNLARQWHRILDRAGLADARFYDLRHTCASLLAAHGLSLKEISSLLGHSTIRVTADTYTHLFPGERKAADAMEEIFPQDAAKS